MKKSHHFIPESKKAFLVEPTETIIYSTSVVCLPFWSQSTWNKKHCTLGILTLDLFNSKNQQYQQQKKNGRKKIETTLFLQEKKWYGGTHKCTRQHWLRELHVGSVFCLLTSLIYSRGFLLPLHMDLKEAMLHKVRVYRKKQEKNK